MQQILDLHKKMYTIRWENAEGDYYELEREFVALAEEEGMDLEEVNKMLEHLYIPPYDKERLPEHLKPQHGGKREGAGRPAVGVTKKVSLTLQEELWEKLEEIKEETGETQSALLRNIIERDLTPYHYEGDPKLYQEFREYVFNTNKSMIYHFYKNDMLMLAKVHTVSPYYDHAGVKLIFEGGNIIVWAESEIIKVPRPANLINTNCEVCYALKNQNGEHIGYIYSNK